MRLPAWAAALAFTLGTSAQAHVAFEQASVAAGSGIKAVMKVGHGCEGSPTTTLGVRIPEGVVQVKPMPKPGWTLKTTTGKYARTYDGLHGAKLSEGVTEITWSGGSLPDGWYDEFSFIATLPDTPGATLLFPVLQTCERGSNDWSEDPRRSSVRATRPAPYLELMPAADPHAGHH